MHEQALSSHFEQHFKREQVYDDIRYQVQLLVPVGLIIRVQRVCHEHAHSRHHDNAVVGLFERVRLSDRY